MGLQIFGTSHIAKTSVRLVREKIISEKPDIVAIELDKSRLAALFEPKRKLKLSDIGKVGLAGFVFAAVGSWLQHKLGEQVGMVPGADMRAAIRAAQQVGAKIALIDRPIQETLQRLSNQMTSWQKVKFFGFLLGSLVLPGGTEVEFDLSKVPEDRIIKKLTKDLNRSFPVIYKVLVKERDLYLAQQINYLEKQNPASNILAVLGAGHLRGVKKDLRELQKP